MEEDEIKVEPKDMSMEEEKGTNAERLNDLQSRPLDTLASETLFNIAKFLCGNDLLSWRAVDVATCKFFESSPIWNSAVQERQWSPPNSASFRSFLKRCKLITRWLDSRPSQQRVFSVDVYSRIKGGGGCELPKHLMMDSENIAVLTSQHQGARFQLTRAFPPETQQAPLFITIMEDILMDALCGMSSTVFFYGEFMG
jgi:hypothetical protein